MHIFDDYKSAEKFLKKTLFAENNGGLKNATWCIIPAGGSGKRFKSNIPKQYIQLNGMTVIERSVDSLLKFPDRASLACIILIISRHDKYCEFLKFAKSSRGLNNGVPIIALRCGGSTRGESVYAGVNFLKNIASIDDWIVVHDAVRPFVSKEALERLWDMGSEEPDGAILAIPVSDTLKLGLVEKGQNDSTSVYIKKTENRKNYWLAQTPQMFKLQLLLDVFQRKTFLFTDEASAIESLGKTPRLILGERKNIKITTPDDLEIAENWQLKEEGITTGHSMRIGQGFDVHKFANEGKFVILGGVKIPYHTSLLGHSDADVLIHAICDAILGAAGLGDIGEWFPDSEPKYKGVDSRKILKKIISALTIKGLVVHQIDATVICEAPKITPYKEKMKEILTMETNCSFVNIKATTAERLGSIGRKEGIAAMALVSLLCE
ncbi:2-C-methyl-D-erythritol 2,4-cyclodiphosphate synthase [Betaproteobacteria bacterium]|nr:2-C-methyl-D-erythritol 2,4-cyclodiphosphate synthase [Betaproteobacteria bacterium]